LVFVRRGLKPYIGLLLLVGACAPFLGVNLVWNYYHCWDNYLFNLVNRTQGTGQTSVKLLQYVGWLFYLISPPVIYFLIKQKRAVWRQVLKSEFGVFVIAFLLPVLLFFLIAGWNSIGLHWLLSFLPMLVMGLAPILAADQFRKCCYFMMPFSLLHVIALFVILAVSPHIFRAHSDLYKNVILGTRTSEIVKQLEPYLADYQLATVSYSTSSLLAYAARRHVLVFGLASYHGRQDDLLTDFRTLAGKNILIFSTSPSVERHRCYFDEFRVYPLEIDGARFYYALGRGFRYSSYNDEVLSDAILNLYDVPNWLPVGSCYMFERYFSN
jgi:hypothetical protein